LSKSKKHGTMELSYFKYLRRFYERPEVDDYFNDYFMFAKVLKSLVVDVGSGLGYVTKELTGMNNSVLSLDINKHTLNFSKKKGRCHNPVLGSVNNLPIKSKSIDVAYFIDVIEHLDYPLRSLEEIKRILKVEGLLFLVTPNGLLSRLVGGPGDSTHVHEFTWWELKKILKHTGFTIVEAIASGLPGFNRLSPKMARKLAKIFHRYLIPLACPSFWVKAKLRQSLT